jgi:regulatory helix-turn-helix LysR family protein
MEPRHLRYLCAVADWNGFNRAASALRTSQSSISAQIRDLQEEIGVKLLNRPQSSWGLLSLLTMPSAAPKCSIQTQLSSYFPQITLWRAGPSTFMHWPTNRIDGSK